MTPDWLACQYPERPYGPGIKWHLECRACRIRLEVDALHMPPGHGDVMRSAMAPLDLL